MDERAQQEVLRYATAVDKAVRSVLGDELVGTYPHGSAALGGFVPKISDVDVLMVVRTGLGSTVDATGKALIKTRRNPGRGLECTVITSAVAKAAGSDLSFELHVSTDPADRRVVSGSDHPEGDQDLILHIAVCRSRSVPVSGPLPEAVFSPIPRDRIIAAMVGELRWGLDNGTEAYAVLNGARAERYVAEHRLFSKVEGGKWALARLPDAPFVQRALDAQLGKVAHQPLTNEGREFVERVIRRFETEVGR